MTEHPTLTIETAIDKETLEVTLLTGGRIDVTIRTYDADRDRWILRSVEITDPSDVKELGVRLMDHGDKGKDAR